MNNSDRNEQKCYLTKVLFYAAFCLAIFVGCVWIALINDRAGKYHDFRMWHPEFIRKFAIPFVNHFDYKSQNIQTVLLGTSHVSYGFNSCENPGLAVVYEYALDAVTMLQLARIILAENREVHLVVEVNTNTSYIEFAEVQQPLLSLIKYQYWRKASVDFAKNLVYHWGKVPCHNPAYQHKPFIKLDESVVDIQSEIRKKNTFDHFEKLMDQFAEFCQRISPSRITLVTLPMHPEILNASEVKTTLQSLEYGLKKLTKSYRETKDCNIYYHNLSEIGQKYPQNKYWYDRGHFLPPVGNEVLRRIDALEFMEASTD